MLPSPVGCNRVRANFDDGTGDGGRRSSESMGEQHLQPSESRRREPRPFPALLGTITEQNGLKPCRARPIDRLSIELKFESQKGNSR